LRALARVHSHDSATDIAALLDHALAVADGHAENDLPSQLRWSRGSLGQWVARSLWPARLTPEACTLVGLALHGVPRELMARLLGTSTKRIHIWIAEKVLAPTGKPNIERVLGVLAPAFVAGVAEARGGQGLGGSPPPHPSADPRPSPHAPFRTDAVAGGGPDDRTDHRRRSERLTRR